MHLKFISCILVCLNVWLEGVSNYIADDSDPPLVKCQLCAETPLFPLNERQHILPKICIICHSEKMKMDPVTRKQMKFVHCEMKGGGHIASSCRAKKKDDVLLHIRNEDLVAVEECYHAVSQELDLSFL